MLRLLTPLLVTASLAMPSNASSQQDGEPIGPRFADMDEAHSMVEFTVRHLGFTRIRGHFEQWNGTVYWDSANVENSSLTIAINVASVYSGDRRRDRDLVSAEFFEAAEFPMALFQSTSVRAVSDGYEVVGDLTLHGITMEVVVPFEIQAIGKMGPGLQRVLAAGHFRFLRSDFNLRRENRLARALSVVSDEVEMEVEIQGVVYGDPADQPFDSRTNRSMGEELLGIVSGRGVFRAIDRFTELSTTSPDEYNASSRELGLLIRKMAQNPDVGLLGEALIRGTSDDYHPVLHLALADAFRSAGNFEDARIHYEEVLRVAPFDSRSREILRHLE